MNGHFISNYGFTPACLEPVYCSFQR